MSGDQQPKFIHEATLQPQIGLELLESIIGSYGNLFKSHPEFSSILTTHLVPVIKRLLADLAPFTTTVRLARIFCLLLRDHFAIILNGCNAILMVLNASLESDKSASWRRELYLEIYGFIYSTDNVAVKILNLLSSTQTEDSSIKSNLDVFAHLAAEKPNLIGIGTQSLNSFSSASPAKLEQEHAVLEAGQAAGTIGNDSSVAQANPSGISVRSSSMKVQYLDLVDKSEPPQSPETYIYFLVLKCVNNLSDTLAKIVLAATVRHQTKIPRKKRTKGDVPESLDDSVNAENIVSRRSQSPPSSSHSHDKAIPPNPLDHKDSEVFQNVQAVAHLIDGSWPAILATSSTFLYASLDADAYRSLIRAFQKYVQVSGLLRLSTPRDAFLTTLGKAAVPSGLMKGSHSKAIITNDSYTKARGMQSPSTESFFSQKSGDSPGPSRRGSIDVSGPLLSQRNLMCLRALVNLAIALGPILDRAWHIVLECIQKAHVLLAVSGTVAAAREYKNITQKSVHETEEGGSVLSLSSEMSAVESAVGRLFQSTAEYPETELCMLVHCLHGLVRHDRGSGQETASTPSTPTLQTSSTQRRAPSVSGVATSDTLQPEYSQFVIARLGETARANIRRMTEDVDNQIWELTVSYLAAYATTPFNETKSRLMAAQVVMSVAVEAAVSVTSGPQSLGTQVLGRSLNTLAWIIDSTIKALKSERTINLDTVSHEVHKSALDGFKTILERTGESLHAHWGTCFELIKSAFLREASDTTLLQSDLPDIAQDASNTIIIISPDL